MIDCEGAPEGALEERDDFELRRGLGSADLDRLAQRSGHRRRRGDVIRDVEARYVADLRVALAVDPRARIDGVEAEVRAEPDFHEIRRPYHHVLHTARRQLRLAGALRARKRRIRPDAAGKRDVDEASCAGAFGLTD